MQAELGAAAAERMRSSTADTGIRHVEGPSRWSPADVAATLSALLGTSVAVDVTPREVWVAAFAAMGFSEAAAASFAGMTALSVDGRVAPPPAWRFCPFGRPRRHWPIGRCARRASPATLRT